MKQEKGDIQQEEEGGEKKKWFKRLGWGAFAFFFIKGLVWLAVFFGLTKFLGC